MQDATTSEELLYKNNEIYSMTIKNSNSTDVQTQNNITDDYAVIFASNYLSLIQSYATVITPVSIVNEIDTKAINT